MSETFYRSMFMERGEGKDRDLVLSFSSEEPVMRRNGFEILDHSPGAVDLSRLKKGAALLVNHDPEKLAGATVDAWIDRRRGWAKVRFSRSNYGEEMLQDVKDRIRLNVSVGYSVLETKDAGGIDGIPAYRVMKWQPYEISLASVPADATVGVGRAESESMQFRGREPGKEIEMTAQERRKLFVKPYIPEPPEPQKYTFTELVRRLEKNEEMPKEVLFGDRGKDIGQVYLKWARDLNLGNDTAGGYLTDTKQPMTAIEYLGAQLIVSRAGAVSVPASAADFSPMPKEVTPPTMYWVAEGIAPPAASDGTWGVVNPHLKTGVVWSDLTRLVTVITGGAADRIVTRAFFKSVAKGLDRATFHGSGLNAEPTGIINVPNVGSIDGGTFSLLKACSMLKAVEDANAAAISWCMSPDVAELLRQRPKAASGERMLLEDGKILNFPAYVSTGIDTGTLICGDFSQVTILNRSLELLVDRFSGSTTGRTRLLVFWFGDFTVGTPAAFCFAQGLS